MLVRSDIDVKLIKPQELPDNTGLMANGYFLSDAQAQAILDMRLQRLTGLEQDKIVDEYKTVLENILDLLDILANPARVNQIIHDELTAIQEQFGDNRRSEINPFGGDIADEDLIPQRDMVVTLTHGGYIKTQQVDDYQAQRRGGRGKQATATKDEDFIETLFIANTHDFLLCFTSLGKCHWIKVYKLPEGGRNSRGRPVNNLIQLEEGEKINTILPVREFSENEYVFMCTEQGIVKKTSLIDFSRPRSAGIIALGLDEGDHLIGAVKTAGKHDIMLFSNGGKAVRFNEDNVRPMGRSARGVRGMKLADNNQVISLLAYDSEEDGDKLVLTATANGYGKRTAVDDYRRSGRGTQGVIAIDTGERNGDLVAATLVADSDDLMLITSGGVLIRTKVDQIRSTGRAAAGVKLINLDEGEKLVSLERIAEPEENSNTEVDVLETPED